eukprot:7182565-Prorocentrum_lima.AAC.1
MSEVADEDVLPDYGGSDSEELMAPTITATEEAITEVLMGDIMAHSAAMYDQVPPAAAGAETP